MIPRVAILCDSPDENWPSMDTVGSMLASELRAFPEAVRAERVAPPIRNLTPNKALNRLWLRFADYPRWLRQNRDRFDLFHIVDHSYSQLAHELPSGRTVVTCHDIDTFRCLLEPERDPRGVFFRAMTRRIVTGFERSAHVACDSRATFADLERYGVIPAERMSVVALGAHPSCSPLPDDAADSEAARLLGPPQIDLLHVGSTIERKQIGALLKIVAGLGGVRLVRVGGPLTPEQRELARELGVDRRLIELPFLAREVLSAVYRRSALVLLPSSAEGFGLPVAEAMACGAIPVTSDLPVLREIGGDATAYCPAGDVPRWTAEIARLLRMRADEPAAWEHWKQKCLEQAANFSWGRYAKCMLDVYNKVLNGCT